MSVGLRICCLAARVVGGDWPQALPDDELALAHGRQLLFRHGADVCHLPARAAGELDIAVHVADA